MISWTSLTEREFQAYRKGTVNEHVQALIWSKRSAADDGNAKAEQACRILLQHWATAPDMFLCAIKQAASDITVGSIWFGLLHRA